MSVLKLSALFAAMQVVSLAALYYVLARLVKIRPLLVLTGFALVTLTFATVMYFVGIDERYYQYWPARFFWPAVSVLGFYCFARRRTLARSCVMSLIGAIGLLWNLDSGLFITVVFGAYLVARLITGVWVSRSSVGPRLADPWSANTYLIAIALHVLVTGAVVAAFLIAISWKAQQSLNLSWLLEYQKIFYSLGFMMLPLPRRFDPWMSVLGVYLIGLISSLSAWRRRIPRVKDDAIFYMSMLGLGLFVYYQGRSHVLNLVTVCWPAVVIMAIFADELLRAIRAQLLSRNQLWLPIAVLSFLLVAGASFLVRIPVLVHDASRQYATRGVTADPVVHSEIEFIKQHSAGRRECLILAKRQGIYYAETGLASPIKGPGVVEILLKADQQRLVDGFLTGNLACVFFGIRSYSDAGFDIPMQDILSRYVVAAKNQENTMLYLQPKP